MYKKTVWGFVLFFVFLLIIAWPLLRTFEVLEGTGIQLGIDLQGGTRLIYKLDLSRVADDPARVAQDVKDIITKRLNAYGMKDLSLSIQGDDRLEVQLPGADKASVDLIKQQIERAGTLTFHLAMDSPSHTRKIDQYIAEERRYRDEQVVYAQTYREWIARRDQAQASGTEFTEPRPEPPEPPKYIVRYEVEKVQKDDGTWEYVRKANSPRVLGNTDDLKVDGRFLSSVYPTVDSRFQAAVGFGFAGEGASRFGDLTGGHIDEPLAIVLDEDVMQVANIEDRISTAGILRGQYTNEEVRAIVTVLRGGSLPTKPQLESEMTVGSLFGQASIRSGVYAVCIGLLAVMACIAVYYLLAGLVANFALVFNILVVLAYVTLFRQTLTLPGIAGILLTIGMAVDANILIFERVREERKRGKGLYQALSTGYQRAFSVIFDSNLTTVITGLVLFNFGTVQVKGFAVTLIAGVIVSFVSALFVTRLIFSALYNIGLLKQFRMLQVFETPRIPFVSYQRPFLLATILVIVASWVLVSQRGKDNYGIDFNGGARITMNLNRPIDRAFLSAQVDKIAKDNPDLSDLFRDWSLQSLGADETGKSTSFTLLTLLHRTSLRMKTASAEESREPGAGGTSPPGATEEEEDPDAGLPPDARLLKQLRTELEEMLESESLLLPAGVELIEDQTLTVAERQAAPPVFRVNFVTLAETKDWIQGQLDDVLATRFPGQMIKVEEIKILPKDELTQGLQDSFRVEISPVPAPVEGVPPAERGPSRYQVVEVVQDFFLDPPPTESETSPFTLAEPFPEVSTVTARVARDLQGKAIVAIFISIVGIIFYISLRFEFIFGLAAIAALVHDVLITIGILAFTDHFFGETIPMKINLPEVAALLTIIGYSINDTIVVFDRIRENLKTYSKKKLDFRDCVDMSINQTLSRTVWTSATTLLTVLSLLIFGGEAVRGFAYTFAIGLVTGTYSSVFVASPVLILLHQRAERRRAALAMATA